jgi:hypothetical protein
MKEADLTLTGFAFELRFTNIERQNTQRRTNEGHDSRDEAPAYVWKGDLEIYSTKRERGITHPFITQTFFQDQVEELKLNDILFLCVVRHLFGIAFRNEEARKFVIDHMSMNLLSSLPFGSDIWQRDPTFNIHPSDFRHEQKDRSLLLIKLIAHERLHPEPGVPGQIWEVEPVL